MSNNNKNDTKNDTKSNIKKKKQLPDVNELDKKNHKPEKNVAVFNSENEKTDSKHIKSKVAVGNTNMFSMKEGDKTVVVNKTPPTTNNSNTFPLVKSNNSIVLNQNFSKKPTKLDDPFHILLDSYVKLMVNPKNIKITNLNSVALNSITENTDNKGVCDQCKTIEKTWKYNLKHENLENSRSLCIRCYNNTKHMKDIVDSTPQDENKNIPNNSSNSLMSFSKKDVKILDKKTFNRNTKRKELRQRQEQAAKKFSESKNETVKSGKAKRSNAIQKMTLDKISKIKNQTPQNNTKSTVKIEADADELLAKSLQATKNNSRRELLQVNNNGANVSEAHSLFSKNKKTVNNDLKTNILSIIGSKKSSTIDYTKSGSVSKFYSG